MNLLAAERLAVEHIVIADIVGNFFLAEHDNTCEDPVLPGLFSVSEGLDCSEEVGFQFFTLF